MLTRKLESLMFILENLICLRFRFSDYYYFFSIHSISYLHVFMFNKLNDGAQWDKREMTTLLLVIQR